MALSRGADRYPYLWLDTGGAIGARLEPKRGAPTKPRPTAWVQRYSNYGFPALKGRDGGHSPPRGDLFPCLAQAYFALSGLATRKRDVFRPRPLAWALLSRPFGAPSQQLYPRCPARTVGHAQPHGRGQFSDSIMWKLQARPQQPSLMRIFGARAYGRERASSNFCSMRRKAAGSRTYSVKEETALEQIPAPPRRGPAPAAP